MRTSTDGAMEICFRLRLLGDRVADYAFFWVIIPVSTKPREKRILPGGVGVGGGGGGSIWLCEPTLLTAVTAVSGH